MNSFLSQCVFNRVHSFGKFISILRTLSISIGKCIKDVHNLIVSLIVINETNDLFIYSNNKFGWVMIYQSPIFERTDYIYVDN